MTEQTFSRIGGSRLVKVDVRVISSTARDLQDEIAHGRFREDLLYRLNVVPVHLPALSERRDDIMPLIDHFLTRYAAERRVPVPRSEERRVGKGCVSTCRSRGSPDH